MRNCISPYSQFAQNRYVSNDAVYQQRRKIYISVSNCKLHVEDSDTEQRSVSGIWKKVKITAFRF